MSTTIPNNAPRRLSRLQRKAKSAAKKRGSMKSHASAGGAPNAPWYRSTFALGLYGGALLYASFPPVARGPEVLLTSIGLSHVAWVMTAAQLLPCLLAWVATVPWLLLARMERLPGRRPYGALYIAGLLHFLILIQWIRLGHWAAHFGWMALVLYLAAYVPLFIGLTRVAVQRLRIPLVLAAPIVWVGLEGFRSWFLTGFSMALLSHTQVAWLSMIQIADLAGEYAVSFVVMFVSAAIATLVPQRWFDPEHSPPPEANSSRAGKLVPLLTAAILLIGVFSYGYYRLHEDRPGEAKEATKIALVQGSIDTDFDDPTVGERTHKQYWALNDQARAHRPAAIIWPESTLVVHAVEAHPSGQAVSKPRWFSGSDEEFADEMQRRDEQFRAYVFRLGQHLAQEHHIPLILGGNTLRIGPHPPERFNSAIYVNEHGEPADAYHKMHPVVFGEFAPGGDWFPWIYDLMPFDEGLTPGERAEVFQVGQLRLCPSICYENTVPHLIRRQVAQLRAEGIEPDVLATLSNDSWFYGSAELDMHLACGRFRAVEMRKPALIAANTGFSAHIDGNGRVLQQGPRRDVEVMLVDVRPDGRSSFYAQTGDWLANMCMLACFGLAGVGLLRWRKT